MSILHAIVLAIVQGVTEFLPISSSGHILVLPWMLHWEDSSSLTFDVMLHTGPLVAILAYFWSDWKRILTGSLVDMRKGQFGKSLEGRLLLLIVLGLYLSHQCCYELRVYSSYSLFPQGC